MKLVHAHVTKLCICPSCTTGTRYVYDGRVRPHEARMILNHQAGTARVSAQAYGLKAGLRHTSELWLRHTASKLWLRHVQKLWPRHAASKLCLRHAPFKAVAKSCPKAVAKACPIQAVSKACPIQAVSKACPIQAVSKACPIQSCVKIHIQLISL